MNRNSQNGRNTQELNDLKDKIKAAFTAEQMANYAGQIKGVTPTHRGKEWRVGSHGAGSALVITQKSKEAVWFDHSENIGGDCFELVWCLGHNQTKPIPKERFGEVVNEAAEYVGVNASNLRPNASFTPKTVKDTPNDQNENKRIYDAFMGKFWETLKKGVGSLACENLCALRGLDRWKIQNWQNIGYTEQGFTFDIPGLKYRSILQNSLVVRNPDTHTFKAIVFCEDGNRKRDKSGIKQHGACSWLPWNEMPEGDLWLVEGEFDALALLFAGYNALPCKPEGANKEQIKRLAEKHRLFLAYDNDEAGRSFTKQAMQLAPNAIDVSPLWGEGKDPNDYAKEYKAETHITIETNLPSLIAHAEQSKAENQMPKEYEAPLKAMEAFKKPKPNKNGEIVMEYERGDIEPICAWLKERGIYMENFATDNGLRTKDKRPITGAWLTGEQKAIQHWGLMPAMGISGPRLMKQAAEYIGEQNRHDALKDYIDNLPKWDGVKRIDGFWAKYCGAKQDETTKGISRYMWTAIIGKALATNDKPCKADMCVILKGEQGIGKSSLVRALSLRNEWFTTLSLDMPEDELKRMLRAAQFVEIGEMGVATRKQRETIKRILTSETMSMRKKGNDEHWYFAVRAFFIATSDETDGILNDPNGFRRWLPVEVKGFKPIQRGNEKQLIMDTESIKRDRDQLYAEAKALYMQRQAEGLEGVWWDAVPLEGQREATAKATAQDENADMVYTWFENTKTPKATLCRICEAVFDMPKERYARDKAFQNRLGEALKLKGFQKQQCRGIDGKTWYWSHPDFTLDDSEF